MSLFKTPKYTPPPAAPPPPNAPTMADSSVLFTGASLRQRAQGAFGQTLMTGPQGVLTDSRTNFKSLLGQ